MNTTMKTHFFQLLDGRVGARVKTREGRVLAELPSVAEQPPFLPQIRADPRLGETGDVVGAG